MSVEEITLGKAVWHSMTTSVSSGAVNLPMRAAIRRELIDGGIPGVMWELRRLLPHLGYKVGDGDYRVIGRLLIEKWKDAAKLFDINFKDHFKFSFQSGEFNGKAMDECSPEWEASTLFVFLIANKELSNRYSSYRLRAKVFISEFIRILFAGSADADEPLPFPAQYAPLCTSEALQGECGHIRFLKATLNEHRQTHSAEASLALFFELATPFLDNCSATHRWIESVANGIARCVEKDGALNHFSDDFINDGGALTMEGKSSKKRTDKSFALAISTKVLKDNRAIDTSTFLRAHPNISRSPNASGRNFDEVYLQSMVSTTWLACEKLDVIGLSYDGVRSGMPATDDLITLLQLPEIRSATWLPTVASLPPVSKLLIQYSRAFAM